MGGALHLWNRPAVDEGERASLFPSEPLPNVASGTRAAKNECPGPQPPLPSFAKPLPVSTQAVDPKERVRWGAHPAAAVEVKVSSGRCSGTGMTFVKDILECLSTISGDIFIPLKQRMLQMYQFI